MTVARFKRALLRSIVVAGLCAAVAGCASEVTVPATDGPAGNHMRYYGGPKSPMWSGQ
ncbi:MULTISPECIES: hypothetical protein [Bradyrhizobium]|jgi:hypothetical protein|uniref:hypothetical protein n=1 Tax=Bradyrhizobium TaxID=374 RepID=UPI00041BC9D6|nr:MULTISPECIES: hypothetical protein [Bradyrhizobium]